MASRIIDRNKNGLYKFNRGVLQQLLKNVWGIILNQNTGQNLSLKCS